ncbi:MAG: LysM peptidoglycan-binding domain-containing protein [Myxococcales bacterium]|nr:LysM peptidoglycan-binding domain-containing protein [Myxococcales bacterium]
MKTRRDPSVTLEPTSEQAQREPDHPGLGQEGQLQAMHTSPEHTRLGNEVDGAGVEVNGVSFSAGQLAALVDYVGPLTILSKYSTEKLLEMRKLLEEACDSTEAWDRVTGRTYSDLALHNQDHFAPGGGGPDHKSSFVGYYQSAWSAAMLAGTREEGSPEQQAAMDEARLLLYTAEHYLQDAFSAGHMVSGGAIDEGVGAVYGPVFMAAVPAIAEEVFRRCSDVISQYGFLGLNPIDTPAEFETIASIGGWWKGETGAAASVRKALHEKLGGKGGEGVVVTSAAHPEPWTLWGDEHIDPIGEGLLLAALSEARDGIELEALVGGTSGTAKALALWERHAPVPTSDAQARIDQLVEEATCSTMALQAAVVEGTCVTIEEAMDAVCVQTHGGIQRMTPREEGPSEEPVSGAPDLAFPFTYVVREGDWLSTIAERFYGDPMLYGIIADENPMISDPDHIEVGWKLSIPDPATRGH